MYLQHFGLSQPPFSLTPDTRFFCDLPTHREALNVLLIALQSGEGFIKITGPVGSGKTLLCRLLLNELAAPFVAVYIPNPHLPAAELYLAVAEELGLKAGKTGQNRTLTQINKHLLGLAAQGKKTVLIIDEAQAMPLETLEALRLLSNLETESQKLLQIVLFGQAELDQVLRQKAIRQLRQRIAFSYRLVALDNKQIKEYLAHRLKIAGAPHTDLLTPIAVSALRFYTRGIPRLINILAHKALLAAYGKGQSRINGLHVYRAAVDTDDTQGRLTKYLRKILPWCLVFGGGIYLHFMRDLPL